MASFWRPHMTPARIAAEKKRNRLIAAHRDAKEDREDTATTRVRLSGATSRKTSKAASPQPNPAGKPTRNVPTPEQADQNVSGIQAGMTLDSEPAWPRTQVSMACGEMGSPATEIKRGETA